MPRDTFLPFYLWRHQSTGLSAGRCSDGPRLPLFVLESHKYCDGLRDLEVYPISRVVALEWAHTISLERAKTVVRFGSRGLSL